ncbi:hypothetical protein [Ahniella affigens]|nr:hypothetical protein [Ahniella affigens]
MIQRLSSVLIFGLLFVNVGPVLAQNVRVSPNPMLYPTLKAAFDAVNNGAHQGDIQIEILADTTETNSAVLNASGVGAAQYGSVVVQPIGVRRIVGDPGAGLPLIDLNGADQVQIDGNQLNNGSLEISNSNTSNVAGTSTIRLRGEIQGAALTGLTIYSRATVPMGTPGGAVIISGATGQGIDTVTATNNVIGAPTTNSALRQGFFCLGSVTSAEAGNASITVGSNRFVDVFAPGANTAAIYVGNGCHTMTIGGNQIHQSVVRQFDTLTTPVTHHGIHVDVTTAAVNAGAIDVGGNRFGARDVDTSDNVFSGGNAKIIGIFLRLPPDQVGSAHFNQITRLQRTGANASGIGDSAAFVGINIASGAFTANNNEIGPLLVETNTGSPTEVTAIAMRGPAELLINGLDIRDMRVRSVGGLTDFRLHGVLCTASQNGGALLRIRNARIGDREFASLISESASPLGGRVVGIQSDCQNNDIQSNTITRISGPSYGGPNGLPATQGIWVRAPANGSALVIKNRVYDLSNSYSVAAPMVQGISVESDATTGLNEVSHNAVFTLQAREGGLASLQGMSLKTASSLRVHDNSVYLGRRPDASQITGDLAMTGVRIEGTGQVLFRQNSVLVEGGPGGGGVPTSAVQVVAPSAALLENNVIANVHTNEQAATTHVALWLVDGHSSTHDYNLIHAGGSGGVAVRRSTGNNHQDYPALASWLAVAGGGTHSLDANPRFQLKDVLHLRGDSPAHHVGATNLDPPMPLDIDDDFRPGGDGLVDLGADELGGGQPQGDLAVSSFRLQFGTVMTGERSNVQTLAVANVALPGAAVLGASIVFDQQGAFFEQNSTCGFGIGLDAGESCDLRVHLESNAPGSYRGSLRLISQDGQTSFTSLEGDVVAPVLSAATANRVFARVGNTVPVSLDLVNGGSPAWWRIDNLVGVLSPFTHIGNGNCGAFPVTVSGATPCSLQATFLPFGTGPVDAIATLSGSAGYQGGAPIDVPAVLRGFGTSGGIGIFPSVVDLGTVLIGNAAYSSAIEVGNPDTVARTISRTTPVLPPFATSGSGTCDASPGVLVPAHGACVQRIEFAPVGVGFFEQVLTFQSSNGDSQTLTIRGTGTSQDVLLADGFED